VRTGTILIASSHGGSVKGLRRHFTCTGTQHTTTFRCAHCIAHSSLGYFSRCVSRIYVQKQRSKINSHSSGRPKCQNDRFYHPKMSPAGQNRT
jgi:hypothetical protein